MRDRDRLYPYLLKELGRNLERVWSLDLADEFKKREIERIEHRISGLRRASQSEIAITMRPGGPHISPSQARDRLSPARGGLSSVLFREFF